MNADPMSEPVLPLPPGPVPPPPTGPAPGALPSLPRLALGTAALAREHVTASQAAGTLARAWAAGVRYFDTAPMYGAGRAEHRLGAFLDAGRRAACVLSTKVGKLVDPAAPGGHGWTHDYSADGVRRSLDASLRRLGTDHVDLLLLHDPDDHWRQAVDEAWPALAELRDQGVVKAIGVGMNQAAMLTAFVRHTSPDLVLLAGQYSLLDTTALDGLLPACLDAGVRVVVAQALHGGLIDGAPAPTFRYRPVDEATAARAAAVAAVCHRHAVPTAAAALRFPLGHPAVATVLTGPETAEQLEQNLAWARLPVPGELWHDLAAEGLLRPDAPAPPAAAFGTGGQW